MINELFDKLNKIAGYRETSNKNAIKYINKGGCYIFTLRINKAISKYLNDFNLNVKVTNQFYHGKAGSHCFIKIEIKEIINNKDNYLIYFYDAVCNDNNNYLTKPEYFFDYLYSEFSQPEDEFYPIEKYSNLSLERLAKQAHKEYIENKIGYNYDDLHLISTYIKEVFK